MKESYLTTKISYRELAIKFGIDNFALISSWVLKFRKFGKEDPVIQQGRHFEMKSKNNKNNKIS